MGACWLASNRLTRSETVDGLSEFPTPAIFTAWESRLSVLAAFFRESGSCSDRALADLRLWFRLGGLDRRFRGLEGVASASLGADSAVRPDFRRPSSMVTGTACAAASLIGSRTPRVYLCSHHVAVEASSKVDAKRGTGRGARTIRYLTSGDGAKPEWTSQLCGKTIDNWIQAAVQVVK